MQKEIDLNALRPIFDVVRKHYPLLLIALSAFLLYGQVMLDRPAAVDHNPHYLRVWVLSEIIFPRGEFWSWTNYLNFGYPTNYFYPFLMDLPVVFLHKASFGLISLAQAYGIVFALALTGTAFCLYAFGAAFGSRGVGLMATLVWLWLDQGANNEGGWYFHMRLGVWISTVSMGLFFLSLITLKKLLLTGERKSLLATAALLGVAMLVHPVPVMAAPIFYGALMLACLGNGSVRPRSSLLQLALVGVLALCLAAPTLLPMIAYSDYADKYPYHWYNLQEVASNMSKGNLFGGIPVTVEIIGVAAVFIYLFYRRDLNTFFLASSVVFFLVLYAGEVTRYLDEVGPDFMGHLNFQRVAIGMRMVFFVLFAQLLADAARGLRRHGWMRHVNVRSRRHLPPAAMALLWLVLALPALWSSLMADKQIQTESTRLYAAGIEKVQAFLEHAPRGEPMWRLGVIDYRGYTELGHGLADLGTSSHVPMMRLSFLPGHPFTNLQIMDPDKDMKKLRALLRAGNVQFLAVTREIKADFLEFLQEEDGLYFYRFTEPSDDPFLKRAGAHIEDIRISDRDIRFSVKETAKDAEPGHLVLKLAYFPNWTCSVGGKALPLKRYQMGKDLPVMVRLPVRQGDYHCRFEVGLPEKLSVALFLLGLLAIAALLMRRRVPAE